MKFIEGGVCAPKGFLAAGVHAGIRKSRSKRDLMLIVSDRICTASAVYTQSQLKGAPVLVTQRNLRDGRAQAVICNSGVANTCAPGGEDNARRMCEIAAEITGVKPGDVIVASTGIIGVPLPLEPIEASRRALREALKTDGSSDAADAILTLDTRKKECAVEFEMDGKLCRIGGIAKGSGMIHPNMATTLCFITSDVAITHGALESALHSAVNESFNMISVDGDTSTNDMVTLMASAAAHNLNMIEFGTPDYHTFLSALTELCLTLAKEVARDGEGATKLIECRVTGAADLESARAIAKTVISSMRVKAAMFGADANWGRIVGAMGNTVKSNGKPVRVDFNEADISFESAAGRVDCCKSGEGLPFSEEYAKQILKQNEIRILCTLREGDACATAYGCDLTYDFVRINGDYRN